MARKQDSLLRKFSAYAQAPAESDPLVAQALARLREEEERRQQEEEEQRYAEQNPGPLVEDTSFTNAEAGPANGPGLVESILGFLNEPGMILTGQRDGSVERPVLDRTEDALRQVVSSLTPDSVERGFASAERDVAGILADPSSTADQLYLAELQRQVEAVPQSRRNQETLQAVSEADGIVDVVRELGSNPSALGDVIGESFGRQAPALLANIASPAVGIPAMFASEFNVERQAALTEAAAVYGVDLTDGVAMARFARDNPDLIEKAREEGNKRGAIIGTASALTMGAVGRVGSSNMSRALYDYLIGAGGGMAGEAGGQLAVDGRITSIGDVYLEGIAEGPTAVAEGIPASIRDSAERGYLAGQMANAYQQPRSLDSAPSTAIEPTQQEMFEAAPEEGPTFEEQEAFRRKQLEADAAYALREQELAGENREATREGLRKSFVRRVDVARDRVFDLQDDVESGSTDQSTLNALAKAQANLRTAEERLENFDTSFAPRTQERPAQQEAAPVVEPTQQELALPDPVVEEPPAPAPAPRPRARKRAGRKAETPAQEQPSTAADQLTALMEESGFSSVTNTDNGTETKLSSAEAAQHVIDNLGKGDARTAARILTNGSTRLVDDTSSIPAGSVDTRAGAYYDPNSGQTYIVASTLDRNQPIVGQILDRAAHEFKHAGDLGDNADLRQGSLNTLIGVERNEEINNRIREAASKNDPVAMAALARLRRSGETGARASLELPAYFIEESRKARRNSGAVNRISRDILSAVRTGAKQIMPGDYTVDLNDVAYLSDRLLEQAATSTQTNEATDENLTAAGLREQERDGFNMIQSTKSARFVAARENGWVYRSMDGKEKFVTSDASSKLKRGAVRNLLEYSMLQNDRLTGVSIDELLSHDELLNDYPPLRDIPVVVDPELAQGAAYYSTTPEDPSHIRVNPNDVRDALRSPRAMDELRGLVLHEIQHAVQDIEGSALGGNPSMFQTPADRKAQVRAKNTMSQFNSIRQEAYDMVRNAESDIPEANRQMIQDILVDYGVKSLTMGEVTARLREEVDLLPEGSQGRELLESLVSIADVAASDRNTARAAQTRAEWDYNDLLGEREASFTQFQRDLQPDQLPRNPEDPDSPTGFSDAQAANSRDYDGRAIIRRNNDDITSDRFEPGEFQPEVEGLASVSDEGNTIPASPYGTRRSRADVAWTMAKRALVPDGGIPNSIAEAVRAAYNGQAARAFTSNALTSNLETALDNVLSNTREAMTYEQLSDRLMNELDAIDSLPTRQERDAAVAELDKKYPVANPQKDITLGKALRAIRHAKRNYTRQIIELRMANPKPLTEKEEAIFRKMIQNDERYTTRAYLSTYNQEIGQQYRETLMKRARKNPTSEEAKTIRGAVDFLVENELIVPDTNTLMGYNMERVRRMYEGWGLGTADNFKGQSGKAAMAKALQDFVGASREDMEARAMGIIEDMLGFRGEDVANRRRFTRTTAPEQTIVSARTDIPAPLRKLLGEVTDPVLQQSVTLHRMGNFISKTKLFNELHSRTEGVAWGDNRTEELRHRLPDTAAFGPLAGKYVSDDMHYAITNVVTVQQDIDVAFGEAMRDPGAAIEFGGAIISKSMRHVVGAQKFSQVVMSPGNMLLNLSGSPMMALMNGIVSPARGVRAVNDASKALRADINIKWVQDTFSRERATELIETGSLDTASVGMLQSDAWQELRKTMLAQARRGETPSVYRAVWETGKEKGGTALAAIRNSYALVDVWVKVATYQKRKEFWTEFNRLENRGMSSEDIRRQAGWDASTTNVSYDRSIPLFRALERNTPFAVFATYFGEAMIRVPVMNMVQAYRDARLAQSATNPEAKILAAGEAFRRAVGTLIATQGVIWSTVAALSAEDDEDRAQRGLDPSWYQNSILVPLGTNKEGHPEYYALNRVDPIGPHNETIVGLIMADDKAQAVVDVMRDFFVPSSAFMSAWQLITDAVSGITGNRDLDKPSQKSSLKEAFPHAYEALTQFENDGDVPENFIALIERMYLPSAVKGIIEEERNVLGLYAYARDPVKSVGFRIMDYEKARNSMSREFRSYMEGDPDPDRVFQRMNQILNKEEEEFDKLAAAYQGLLASPVDPTDAMGRKFSPGHARTIFTDAGLGSLVRNLARQEFKSTILEPEVMERWYDREYRKKKTREERRKLAQSRRIWMLAYRDVMKERRENE